MKYLNEFRNLEFQIIFFSLHQESEEFFHKIRTKWKEVVGIISLGRITEPELCNFASKLSVIATVGQQILY